MKQLAKVLEKGHTQMAQINDTLVERGNRYGKFIDNAEIAQHLKRYIRLQPSYDLLAADQREALDNICIKMSRILSQGTDPEYVDNWVDMAGYASLVVDRLSINNKT